ncbi:MAG: DNA recombination protein RmuC [Patescibacteria group bacterium]
MTEIFYLVIIAILGVMIVFLFLNKRKEGDTSFLMIQTQLNELRGTLDAKLGDSTKMFQQQFVESAKIIREVTERLTKLDETNKQVISFADQLQSLEETLQNPKHRGILGEYYLEMVLKNVLPPSHYQVQYQFSNGDMVDAVIFIRDKMVPIDSKFSLENYNRLLEERDETARNILEKKFKEDLKNRIDETAKYIRPEQGTMDFAFMFIPAEGLYYDLLVNQVGTLKTNTRDLIEYAHRDKHVIIVSPTSFFAYLQTVLQGLRALEIEESAKEIRKRVEILSRHLLGYEEYMKKLGVHLGTTVNTYNTAYKELGKIDKDVLKITGASNEPKVLELQKPEEE